MRIVGSFCLVLCVLSIYFAINEYRDYEQMIELLKTPANQGGVGLNKLMSGEYVEYAPPPKTIYVWSGVAILALIAGVTLIARSFYKKVRQPHRTSSLLDP